MSRKRRDRQKQSIGSMPAPRTVSPFRGLKRVASKATGAVYWYHRATKRRLRHDPNSSAGVQECRALDRLAQEGGAGIEGSLASIIGAYKDPQAGRAGRINPFRMLRGKTPGAYQRALDYLADDAADLFPDDMKPREVQSLVDTCAEKHGWSAGNQLLITLRAVINWGIYHELCERNPCVGVLAPKRPEDREHGNRRWTDHEFSEMWRAAPDTLRLALALGLFASMRAHVARAVPWSAYRVSEVEGIDGEVHRVCRLKWRPAKRGDAIDMAVTGPLQILLDAALKKRRASTILESAWGKPFTETGFAKMFIRTRDALIEAGRIDPGLTFHGLRVTLGSWAADQGESDNAIAAAIWDKTAKMGALYRRGAEKSLSGDRIRMGMMKHHEALLSAGMEKPLENSGETPAPEPIKVASNVRILKGKKA